MIIAIFNAQCTMMKQVILFMIKVKRIKNKNKYKNLCDSTVTRENIIYLLK